MDLISYLEKQGIEYTIGPSRNVRSGFVGIQCPYPSCGDKSNHCGIGPTFKHHCLRCGRSGDMVQLIREVEHCSWDRAKKIFSTFKDGIGTDAVSPPRQRYSQANAILESVEYPILMKKFGREHKMYLIGRGFSPKTLIQKYSLYSTDHLGWLNDYDFRFRIIIPIIYKGRVVSFTSRDITGQSDLPYFHLPKKLSIISPKESIYNYDSVKKRGAIIIVEGVTDAWRIGDGAVCIFGKTMTDNQIEMLLEKEVKRVYVLLDSDAAKDARKLFKTLRGIIPSVKRISLDIGDPAANLTRRDIDFLKGLINEKKKTF